MRIGTQLGTYFLRNANCSRKIIYCFDGGRAARFYLTDLI